MTVTIIPEPDLADVLAVAENLRERDRAEIFATRYGDDPLDLARDTVRTGAFRWGAYADGRPVAMIGAFPRWPNVWSVWAFGTDEWPRVVRALTRHVRSFMIPALYHAGAVRADCHALETHTDARKWLTYLGAREANRLDFFGRNGECFVEYVWLRSQTKPARET